MPTKQKPIVDTTPPTESSGDAVVVKVEDRLENLAIPDTGGNTGRPVPVETDLIAECFGDLDAFKTELGALLKSPNPLMLFQQGNVIREKFSHFVNCLAMQVAGGFSSRNSAFIVSLYYSAGYQRVWLDHFRYYFSDAKFFDRQIYFLFVTLFSKDKQLLAKWLLKMYKKEKRSEIESLLRAYEGRRFSETKRPKKLTYEEILATYHSLGIDSMVERIPEKYLSENEIEKFLDQLSLQDEIDIEQLFSVFAIQFKDTKEYFDEMYTVFAHITRSYLNGNEHSKQVLAAINAPENAATKLRIDMLIARYKYEKTYFYADLQTLLAEKSMVEREYFSSYVRTRIINVYYPSVTMLFYWNTQACKNRNEWAKLRGDFKPSVNSRYKNETEGILAFKKLIMEFDTNIFAPFLKPIVYSIVSERLNITEKDLHKLRYLLTLVTSESYDEYRRIATFFDELEAFLGFGTDGSFQVLAKLKVFAANIVLASAAFVASYIFAPIGVTASIAILLTLFAKRHFFPYQWGVKWNFGLRTFAIGLLTISCFFWFLNLEKTKTDIGNVTKQVEQLGVVRTDSAVRMVAQEIENLPVKEMVANVLEAIKR